MAQDETDQIRTQMQSLEAQLEILLLPKDPLDDRSIMLEVSSTHPVCLSKLPLQSWCSTCSLTHIMVSAPVGLYAIQQQLHL